MTAPRIAAVIVSYRDDPRVAACLDALRAAEGVVVSAVLVENAAAPGPPPSLGGRDGGGAGGAVRALRRLRRAENPGFAAGFDDGLALADADAPFVLSLNPDCVVAPDAPRAAVDALAADPRAGAVAFRLLRADDPTTLDGAGVVLDRPWWRARDRDAGLPAAGRRLVADDVDAACLAGALLRRAALEEVRDVAGDVLDRRYFAYQEDVDLGLRLARVGRTTRYVPTAVAFHARGWRPGARREIPLALRRASLRNRLWTILKNVDAREFLVLLPALLLYEFARAAYLLVREPDVLPAYGEAWRGAAESLRRRRARQKA